VDGVEDTGVQRPEVKFIWYVMSGSNAAGFALQPASGFSPGPVLPFDAICLYPSHRWPAAANANLPTFFFERHRVRLASGTPAR
jgi:hypothetical protein